MSVTSIILSHYKERQGNLIKIIQDLRNGSVKPDKIIVICDNPDILVPSFPYVDVVRFDTPVLPIIRFAIGSIQETTHCLFIDDDLTVGKDTLKQFIQYAKRHTQNVLGFEGNINGKEYTDGKSVNPSNEEKEVDIIIRTYFAPVKILTSALQIRSWYPELPKTSLDDIFLCLGNKYINGNKNFVVPSTPESLPKELDNGGVGQCLSPSHYSNRNLVCRFLKNRYE